MTKDDFNAWIEQMYIVFQELFGNNPWSLIFLIIIVVLLFLVVLVVIILFGEFFGALLGFPLCLYYLKGSLDNDTFRKRAANIEAKYSIIAFTYIALCPCMSLLSLLFGIWFDWYYCIIMLIIFLLSCVIMHGFNFVAFTLPQIKRPELFRLQYEEYGRLRNWSQATQAFRNKINWTDRFLDHAVDTLGVVTNPNEDSIVILSPSANNGECEVQLAKKTATSLNKRVIMYASDAAILKKHVPSFSDESIDFHYNPGLSDDQLEATYDFKFDAIFDLKGVLWHHSASRKKLKDKAQELMSTYYHLLKPGGIVIIDGYSPETWRTFFAQFQLQYFWIFRRISWFAEKSTYAYFTKLYKQNTWLKERFEEVIVSDGIYSLVYYKKLAVNDDTNTINTDQ